MSVDETYAKLYGADYGDEEEDRKVSSEPIKSFSYYVLKAEDGKGSFTDKKHVPVAQPRLQVIHGPAGTIGERLFESIYLSLSETKYEGEGDNRVEVPKTEEEFAKQAEAFNKRMNKIARVLKFNLKKPNGFSADEVEAYAKQFSNGVLFVAEVWTSKAQGNYPARNKINWNSIASPDDPAVSKKAPAGQTALDEALQKIKEDDTRTAKAKPNTAGALSKDHTQAFV